MIKNHKIQEQKCKLLEDVCLNMQDGEKKDD